MIENKNPNDILNFMDNIEYGYIDLNGEKVNNLKNFKVNYRTMSIEQILENRIGTCIEQALLMHDLLDKLNIANKMFCIRVCKDGEIRPEENQRMHCFVLYYDENGVHHIEHPHIERRGIYHFKSEEEALKSITDIYVKRFEGIARPLIEYTTVNPGLSYKEFSEYINSLEDNKRIK